MPTITIQFADSNFYTKSDIDLLIGSDLIAEIMKTGVQHNICGTLLEQETVFGRILSGPIFNLSSHMTSIAVVDAHHNKSNFWVAVELSKKPTTLKSKSTEKAIHMEELSKTPTTSAFESTAKSILNGKLVVIQDFILMSRNWEL